MASGLLLRWVGGRRSSFGEPFNLGSLGPTIEEPFDVERDVLHRDIEEPFWVLGSFALTVVEPFVLTGPAYLYVEEPFEVRDASVGVYDEGGVAEPMLGWWAPPDHTVGG